MSILEAANLDIYGDTFEVTKIFRNACNNSPIGVEIKSGVQPHICCDMTVVMALFTMHDCSNAEFHIYTENTTNVRALFAEGVDKNWCEYEAGVYDIVSIGDTVIPTYRTKLSVPSPDDIYYFCAPYLYTDLDYAATDITSDGGKLVSKYATSLDLDKRVYLCSDRELRDGLLCSDDTISDNIIESVTIATIWLVNHAENHPELQDLKIKGATFLNRYCPNIPKFTVYDFYDEYAPVLYWYFQGRVGVSEFDTVLRCGLIPYKFKYPMDDKAQLLEIINLDKNDYAALSAKRKEDAIALHSALIHPRGVAWNYPDFLDFLTR
jgi:hypothetical protein